MHGCAGGLWWLVCFSSRRRHTRYWRDWSSDVCSSDLRSSGRANPTLSHHDTATFAFFTVASPSRVWPALTDETQTPDYLYGLALSSEGSADPFITTASIQDVAGLTRQGLCAWPTHRLSYLLCAPQGLDDSDEVEDTWLPVLDALRRLLDSPPHRAFPP